MKTVFLHGLGSTSNSLKYLSKFFDNPVLIDYNSYRGLDVSIHEVTRKIKDQVGDSKFNLIGHSLGGLIGAHLALNNEPINKLVTISSPLGGSNAARLLQFVMVGMPIFADVTPRAWHIRRVLLNKPVCDVLSIVSTEGGWPILGAPNDGTVELSSQRALQYAKKVEIAANHFEVLLTKDTVNHIGEFLK